MGFVRIELKPPPFVFVRPVKMSSFCCCLKSPSLRPPITLSLTTYQPRSGVFELKSVSNRPGEVISNNPTGSEKTGRYILLAPARQQVIFSLGEQRAPQPATGR